MCVNFARPSWNEIEAILADDRIGDLWTEKEVWPTYDGAIVRWDAETGRRVAEIATFGLLPVWAKEASYARHTANARTETVAEKPSFKASWKASRRCLVPMRRYYEPNWETGKAVRWSIARNDTDLFCAAGLWNWWPSNDKEPARASFALLTVNCDSHPVLRRFHGPEDEKRSLIHIPPDQHAEWLSADPETARSFFMPPDAEALVIAAAPLPPRTGRTRRASDPLLD